MYSDDLKSKSYSRPWDRLKAIGQSAESVAETEPVPPAKRPDPDALRRLPSEIRNQLRPHYSAWEPVTDREQQRSLRAGDNTALFRKSKRGWEAMHSVRDAALGDELIALRRRPPVAKKPSGGAAGPSTPTRRPTQSDLYAAPETFINVIPTVLICTPRDSTQVALDDTTHSAALFQNHTFANGDDVDGVTNTLLGYADPDAIYDYNDNYSPNHPPQEGALVRVLAGRQLIVDGSATNARSVQLNWRGPTRGSKGISLPEAGQNETVGWKALIPTEPGDYTFTATAGSASDTAKVNVLPAAIPLVELLYHPASDTFYGLSRPELLELLADAKPLQQAVEQLQSAQQGGDPKAIAQAKQTLNDTVKPLVHSAEASDLTEVIRLAGKKYTYIRSDKMKNHWRGYKLDADDKKQADQSAAALNLKHVCKAIAEKKKEGPDYTWTLGDEQYAGYLNQWATAVHKKLTVETANSDDPHRSYDASASAQLLRYCAGASLATNFNPKTLKGGVKGKLDGEIALAEGRAELHGYLPDAEGCHVKFNAPGLQNKEVDLGGMRATIELALGGFAGASVLACTDIEFNPEGGKLLARGTMDKASAGASAFAGAKLDCDANGKLEWKNPEDNHEFKEFCTVGCDGAAAAGLGAEAEFRIAFHKGKFYIRAKAGIVCGIGATGKLEYEVDADLIWEFVQFVYHKVKDLRQDYSLLIDKYAYEYFCAGLAWYSRHMETSLDSAYNDGPAVLHWWQHGRFDFNETQMLIAQLEVEQRIAKFAPAPVRGRLLEMLRLAAEEANKTGDEGLLIQCESSIIKLLNYVQDRGADYVATLRSMTLDGGILAEVEGEQQLVALGSTCPRVVAWLENKDDALPQYAEINTHVRNYDIA